MALLFVPGFALQTYPHLHANTHTQYIARVSDSQHISLKFSHFELCQVSSSSLLLLLQLSQVCSTHHLLTHGSQPSALVPLHKWTVAPFSSHLATASPWTNRSSSVHAHSAFGPGHPQLQHQHLASHCSLLSSVTCCLFSHSHLVLCKHFIRNKSIYVCLYRQMPKPVLVTIMPTGIKERTVGLGLLIKR